MLRTGTSIVLASVLGLFCCQLLAGETDGGAPAPKAGKANPFTSEADIRRGQLTVRAYCSVCHGRDGTGGRGANLKGRLRRGSTDEAILNNIKNGIPGTDMPGFPVDDEYIWPVISYIRSASNANPKPPEGNIENGADLFKKHSCGTCHWTGTSGGRRGPDLSALASSADYVKTSIIDPDANFREAPAYQHDPYQQVIIETQRGRVSGGRWLNENAYYLQFIDDHEILHTVAQSDLASLEKPRHSLMPTGFGTLLSEKELQDLIAYLFSLRPEFPDEESK